MDNFTSWLYTKHKMVIYILQYTVTGENNAPIILKFVYVCSNYTSILIILYAFSQKYIRVGLEVSKRQERASAGHYVHMNVHMLWVAQNLKSVIIDWQKLGVRSIGAYLPIYRCISVSHKNYSGNVTSSWIVSSPSNVKSSKIGLICIL